jgi:hypothetical protein
LISHPYFMIRKLKEDYEPVEDIVELKMLIPLMLR